MGVFLLTVSWGYWLLCAFLILPFKIIEKFLFIVMNYIGSMLE